MTDYTELVKALRSASAVSTAWEKLMTDAAAAIEVLEAEIRESMQKCAECGDRMVEPKRGEWIDRYDEDDKPFFKRKYVCSACSHWNTYGKSKYCPKCGAKMGGTDE